MEAHPVERVAACDVMVERAGFKHASEEGGLVAFDAEGTHHKTLEGPAFVHARQPHEKVPVGTLHGHLRHRSCLLYETKRGEKKEPRPTSFIMMVLH